MIKLDHIAISGSSLCEASEYVESCLGVRLQNGGSHERYGTHNRLLGLTEGIYLEVIAIDPNLQKPPHPRWFDLDNFSGKPRITNWICESENIRDASESLHSEGFEIIEMKRDQLKWLMALPRNGILPFDGTYPALLTWITKSPASKLTCSGCSLNHLTILHPEYKRLKIKLGNFKDPRISFEYNEVAKFIAEFNTPHGVRKIV